MSGIDGPVLLPILHNDHREKSKIDVINLQECRFQTSSTNWTRSVAKTYGYSVVNGKPQYNRAGAGYGGLLTAVRGNVRKIKIGLDDEQVLITQVDRGSDTRPCLVVNLHIQAENSQ